MCNSTGMSNKIFDVGAHKGEDTAFYLALGYSVVAVEANPKMVAILEERFRNELADGRLIIIPKAIARESGKVTLFVNNNSVWGTIDANWAERNKRLGSDSHTTEVKSVQFKEVLTEYGRPYYIKIDIEGADRFCLEDLVQMKIRPTFVSIESEKVSWRALLKEFELLESLGYKKFAVVNQRGHSKGRFRDANGNWFEYEFEEGSSGPFGNMLDERLWVSKRKALVKYALIFIVYNLLGDSSLFGAAIRRVPILKKVLRHVGWYDTHAAIN